MPISNAWMSGMSCRPSDIDSELLATDPIVVVGASGILRPLVSMLLANGNDVIGVARGKAPLVDLSALVTDLPGRLRVLATDASVPSFPTVLDRLLASLQVGVQAMVIYGPASSAVVVEYMSASRRCPLVEVLTSSIAQPQAKALPWTLSDLPARELHHRRLVLGWKPAAAVSAGTSRWHSAEEVSAAAFSSLTHPGDHVLGAVSPWDERPG